MPTGSLKTKRKKRDVRKPSPETLIKRVWPPMLATLVKTVPDLVRQYVAEVKYDGYRAISALSGQKLSMVTRNALDLTGRFPAIAAALHELVLPEAVIDGEICAFDNRGVSSFQRLMSPGADQRLVAFDLLWLDGRDLRSRPLEERHELLVNAISNAAEEIQLAQRLPGSPAESVAIARRLGLEGVVFKRLGSPYLGRRSLDWLKYKVNKSQEVTILGYTPQSKGKDEIGALLIGVWNGKGFDYAGKVGTGFTEKLRSQLRKMLDARREEAPAAANAPRIVDAVWAKPELVAQVSFTEWTEDGRFRHPSFQGLRVDKKPEETAREV